MRLYCLEAHTIGCAGTLAKDDRLVFLNAFDILCECPEAFYTSKCKLASTSCSSKGFIKRHAKGDGLTILQKKVQT